MKPWEKYQQPAVEQAPSEQPAGPWQKYQQPAAEAEKDYDWRGLIRQGLQGLTFGTSDELGAGVATLPAAIASGNFNLPEIYGDIHEALQYERNQFKEDNPYSALAAELAGGVATGGIGAGKLLAAKGIRSLRPMAQAATVGGIEGGAYGFLSGDRGERLKTAGVGAAGGAIGAPIIKTAGAVASRLGAPAVEKIKRSIVGTPATDAEQYLGNVLAREGVESIGQISGNPSRTFTTLADVSEGARGALEGVVSDIDNPRIRALAKRVLTERNRGQQSRLFDAIDEGLQASGRSFREVVGTLKTIRGEVAGPLYDQARQKSIRMTPYMKAVLGNRGVPEVKAAMNEAIQRTAAKRAAGDRVSNIDVIDEMKRGLDDDIKALIRQGKNNRARDLVRVKNKILADVDDQVPEYKLARDAFAGESQLIDAAEEGTKILKGDIDHLDDMLDAMSESEKQMFRVGAKKAVREKLMQAREGTNSVNRVASEMNLERMRRAFPSDEAFSRFKSELKFEASIFDTERVLHNSMTALRQAAQKNMERGGTGELVESLGSDTAGIIAGGLKRIFSRGMSPEAKEQLGTLLLTPIQRMPPEMVQRLNKTIVSRIPDSQRNEVVELLKKSVSQASMAAPGIAATSVVD